MQNCRKKVVKGVSSTIEGIRNEIESAINSIRALNYRYLPPFVSIYNLHKNFSIFPVASYDILFSSIPGDRGPIGWHLNFQLKGLVVTSPNLHVTACLLPGPRLTMCVQPHNSSLFFLRGLTRSEKVKSFVNHTWRLNWDSWLRHSDCTGVAGMYYELRHKACLLDNEVALVEPREEVCLGMLFLISLPYEDKRVAW